MGNSQTGFLRSDVNMSIIGSILYCEQKLLPLPVPLAAQYHLFLSGVTLRLVEWFVNLILFPFDYEENVSCSNKLFYLMFDLCSAFPSERISDQNSFLSSKFAVISDIYDCYLCDKLHLTFRVLQFVRVLRVRLFISKFSILTSLINIYFTNN